MTASGPPRTPSPRRGPAPKVLAHRPRRRRGPAPRGRSPPIAPSPPCRSAGRYRLIDFVLSNFVNSGLLKIKVLTQYKSDSLNTHIARGWRLPAMLDHYVEVVPAQQRTGQSWFRGSADAVYQSLNVITDEKPDYASHLRRRPHLQDGRRARCSTAHVETRGRRHGRGDPGAGRRRRARSASSRSTTSGKVLGLRREAARSRRRSPAGPGWASRRWATTSSTPTCSSRRCTRDAEARIAARLRPQHPARHGRARRQVSTPTTSRRTSSPARATSERGYWRDVGTIGAYWAAQMDLVEVEPLVQPLQPRAGRSAPGRDRCPPAKFVFADQARQRQRAHRHRDRLAGLRGLHHLRRPHRTAPCSPRVRINSFSHVEESILFDGVDVGRHARIRRAIIDKDVRIPPHTEIGFDPEADAQALHHLRRHRASCPKGYTFEGSG